MPGVAGLVLVSSPCNLNSWKTVPKKHDNIAMLNDLFLILSNFIIAIIENRKLFWSTAFH